jgi:aryl carrier-like protein
MADDPVAERELRRRGLLPMAPERAIRALEQALDHDETALAVADIDWTRFAPAFAAARGRPLLHELPEAQRALGGPATVPAERDDTTPRWRARLDDAQPHERQALVADFISQQIAEVTQQERARLPLDVSLTEIGLDSLMLVELRNRVQAGLGVPIALKTLAQQSSLEAFAARLLEEMSLQSLLSAVRADELPTKNEDREVWSP